MKDKNNWLYAAIGLLLAFGVWTLMNSSKLVCVILGGHDSASCYDGNATDVGVFVANLIGPFLPVTAIACFAVWIVLTVSRKGGKPE